MTKIKYAFSTIIITSSLIFLFVTFFENLDSIQFIKWTAKSGAFIAASIIMACLCILSGSIVWRILLAQKGISLSVLRSFEIVAKSNVGKYIPGNIFHFVSRVSLAKNFAISPKHTILSMSVESFLAVCTGLLLGFFGCVFKGNFDDLICLIINYRYKSFYILFYIILAVIIFYYLFYLCKSNQLLDYFVKLVNWYKIDIIICIIIFLFNFLIYGIILYFVSLNIWNLPHSIPWYYFIDGFAFAWAVGFLVPGAPGGMGVREAIMVAIYSSEFGGGVIVCLIITMRFITILADVFSFSFAVFVGKYYARWLK